MPVNIISNERVENYILFIRGQRVIIDMDLAMLFKTSTRTLNQAIGRNIDRFPSDFRFILSKKEKNELVTNCDRFNRLKHSTSLPSAFTEHGVVMAANVIRSKKAVEASIYVVRAFVRLRELMTEHKDLLDFISEIEAKVRKHDVQIESIIDTIKKLLAPPVPTEKKIGFLADRK